MIRILFVSLLLTAFQAQAATPEPAKRTITASGQSEIKVEPDEVVLTFGVETMNINLQVAKDMNDAAIEKVLNAVKENGVESKHVKTDFFSIEPRYESNYKKRDLIGYVARKNIVVTLRNVDAFENVLSSSLESGANYVHGIQFGTTKLREHRDKARALAIKAAKEKAIALAGELNQKIGKPQSISEGHSGWYSWYRHGGWGYGMARSMSQNVVQDVGGSAGSSQTISPGQISVTANVTVVFELLS